MSETRDRPGTNRESASGTKRETAPATKRETAFGTQGDAKISATLGRAGASGPPRRPAPPCALVIFGNGDLAHRKLIPALYNLAKAGLLPERWAVLGVGRAEMSDEEYREGMRREARRFLPDDLDAVLWEKLTARLYWTQVDAKDTPGYERLSARLGEIDAAHETGGNAVFYLATPPSLFAPIVENLGASGLAAECNGSWRRVVVEKPFGTDHASARDLNRRIQSVLEERQIYRIDHYLGKETVQNLLILRFANGILEPIWNRRYVDHIQITVAEEIGIGHRAGFYETAGALRDMVPNHLFQILALTTMEPPTSFEADAVRDEKEKILRAMQPMTPEEVLRRTVRGQYGSGRAPDGGPARGYREEPNVEAGSTTETFVAFKTLIDNWRWADVPFYMRTGKRLPRRVSEVAIQFKRAPYSLFRDTPIHELTPNLLVVRIQPDEGIFLRIGAKVPGPVMRVGGVDMEFCYSDYFGSTPSTGYETLLYDCMSGDATLFQRGDNIESAWRVVEPILDVWRALPPRDFPNYAAGSEGPEDAARLLERDGRRWREFE